MTTSGSAPKKLGVRTFACPHCKATAAHDWYAMTAAPKVARPPMGMPVPVRGPNAGPEWYDRSYPDIPPTLSVTNTGWPGTEVVGMFVSLCHACYKASIWKSDTLIYPEASYAPPPNEDLSDEIKALYREAASIVPKSPRGASALMRLSVEKLVIELGAEGRTLDDKIGWLVSEKGLSVDIQRMLDTVRVIGNEFVHPGTMDLTDDQDTALMLFNTLNLIAMQLLTQPRMIEAQWEMVPENKRKAAEARDARNAAKKES